jgi:hypothetical protein
MQVHLNQSCNGCFVSKSTLFMLAAAWEITYMQVHALIKVARGLCVVSKSYQDLSKKRRELDHPSPRRGKGVIAAFSLVRYLV